jgi:hypothetical protein
MTMTDQNKDLLPIDPLELPILSLPTELFDPLYEDCTDVTIFPTSVPPSTSTTTDEQLEYVPLFSLTSHSLYCNPLFYFDVQKQQFLPLDQPYYMHQLSSVIHTPLESSRPTLVCNSCHQLGHESITSIKCDNYR